jgi:DNA polymerase III sliding clamp (beta) subunit (PCNA family)
MDSLTEIVNKHYTSTKIEHVDYKNNQLKLVLDDSEIRWYELDGDKLYYYEKKEIEEKTHVQKFKSIFREIKINQIIE